MVRYSRTLGSVHVRKPSKHAGKAWGVVAACLVSQVAAAQSRAVPALSVENDASGCLVTGALRERIAHYSAAQTPDATSFRVALHGGEQAVELALYRADALVARRRFSNLPEVCSDRRDALALSIALAIEHAVQEQAQAGAAGVVQPSAAAGVRSPAADSGGANQAIAPESDTSEEPAQVEAGAEARVAASVEEQRPEVVSVSPRAAAQDRGEEPEQPAEDSEDTGVLWGVQAGGRWLLATLPSPVLAGSAGVELQLSPSTSFELSGLVSSIAQTRFANALARTQLLGGEAVACRAARFASFAAQGCIGAALAAYLARGSGYYQSLDTTLFWAAALGRVSLRWPHSGPLALRASLQAHFNVRRPELRVEGATEPLSTGVFGGALGIDMIVALQ